MGDFYDSKWEAPRALLRFEMEEGIGQTPDCHADEDGINEDKTGRREGDLTVRRPDGSGSAMGRRKEDTLLAYSVRLSPFSS